MKPSITLTHTFASVGNVDKRIDPSGPIQRLFAMNANVSTLIVPLRTCFLMITLIVSHSI